MSSTRAWRRTVVCGSCRQRAIAPTCLIEKRELVRENRTETVRFPVSTQAAVQCQCDNDEWKVLFALPVDEGRVSHAQIAQHQQRIRPHRRRRRGRPSTRLSVGAPGYRGSQGQRWLWLWLVGLGHEFAQEDVDVLAGEGLVAQAELAQRHHRVGAHLLEVAVMAVVGMGMVVVMVRLGGKGPVRGSRRALLGES